MQKALLSLDSLEGGPGAWTFGGGTALAQSFDHRISYDVDIFLDSSTALKRLAPNMNPVTKALCGGNGRANI
ncbi:MULTISPECIES: nucleotidyl transferase AbiEii/AbiGii toxin family protein [unclassified Bradyrhizobium]|uniref:nucleotidyl transferase AbiEii/AbiGii toxin family protein n=1 Tax=unclassified Bradyrhizobium TaxID=2631580 RepID=UPI0029169A09|nr:MULTISPECIES: nucleotidyl transferase AbiEii/AbiGii toxin family protein [unclassified Bradyrhizobium]